MSGTFEAKEVWSDVPLVNGFGIFSGEHASNSILTIIVIIIYKVNIVRACATCEGGRLRQKVIIYIIILSMIWVIDNLFICF